MGGGGGGGGRGGSRKKERGAELYAYLVPMKYCLRFKEETSTP